MYRITLTIENPMSGIRKALVYQFDEDTLTEAKWTSAFPSVDEALTEVKTASAVEGKEPPVW